MLAPLLLHLCHIQDKQFVLNAQTSSTPQLPLSFNVPWTLHFQYLGVSIGSDTVSSPVVWSDLSLETMALAHDGAWLSYCPGPLHACISPIFKTRTSFKTLMDCYVQLSVGDTALEPLY